MQEVLKDGSEYKAYEEMLEGLHKEDENPELFLSRLKNKDGSFKKMIGMKFGRLTVLEDSGKRTPHGRIIWLCLCCCADANLKEAHTKSLKSGDTKSCGCLNRERMIEFGQKRRIHGDSETRLYRTYFNMKDRCYRKKSKRYKNYGARGITICPSWLNDYLTFKAWALRNGYQDNLTIDRRDNNGNYSPKNCQWLTKSENSEKARRNRKLLREIKV